MPTASKAIWVVFALFATGAIWFHRHEASFAPVGPLAAGKLVVWAAFVGFTAYSFYCSLHEDLIGTIRKMGRLHWGRQIGLDLYLGLALSLFVIALHEGVLVMLVWLLPTLVFANQVTLLYVALHYDSLVARFVTG